MEQIILGSVKVDAYKYHKYIALKELEKREKFFSTMATLQEVRDFSKQNVDDSINISLIALDNLEEMGFNRNDFSTIALANMIEDIYHERSNFDSSDYFDLSNPDNPHYKYLADRYMIGNKDIYRGLIASAIGSSNCETKNINEIVFGVTKNIINKVDETNSIKMTLETK